MNDLWFDREELLDLLAKRIEGFQSGYRQNLALLGPEGIGKSRLLKRLLQERAAPALVRVYLEVAEGDNLVEWALRFIQTLLYGVLQTQGSASVPTQPGPLLRLCESTVPQTVSAAVRALKLAEAGRSDEAYDLLWDLPEILAQETGFRVVLVIDEFHRLGLLPVRQPFGALGRKIMVQSSTMHLVSSSEPALARGILREGLALLFGQFETLELGPLGEKACRAAIRRAGLPGVEGSDWEHILMQLAQGHPGRLDLLLREWKACTALAGPDSSRIALEMLERLFLSSESVLRQEFEGHLRRLPSRRSRLSEIQTLSTIASGLHRVRSIAEALGRSSSQVVQALRVLEEKRLIVRHGVFAQVPDRLFRLWMVTAHPLLHGIGWLEGGKTAALFREAMRGCLAQLGHGLRTPMESRVIELMRRWGGEQMPMEGRRLLLPHFSRIVPADGPGGRRVLLAQRLALEEAPLRGTSLDKSFEEAPPRASAQRAGGKRPGSGWAFIVWEGGLEEKESRLLMQWIRAQPALKGYRWVVVGPFPPVEVNARLILQEGRVRLWDLSSLNDLLDWYGLPQVPLPAEAGAAPVHSMQAIPEQTGGQAAQPAKAPEEVAG